MFTWHVHGANFSTIPADDTQTAESVPVPPAALRPKPSGQPPITMCHRYWRFRPEGHAARRPGQPVSERQRVVTPAVPTPEAVLKGLDELRILHSAIRSGLGRISWRGQDMASPSAPPIFIPCGPADFHLQKELEKRWKKPVPRGAMMPTLQGYGAIKGDGVELVMTLGTGLGGSLFTNGRLCPGLEIGHHPWRKKDHDLRGLPRTPRTRQVRQEALEQAAAGGHQDRPTTLFNWDHLYLGGGNTKKIDFKPRKNVEIVSNESGLLGGVTCGKTRLECLGARACPGLKARPGAPLHSPFI